MPKKKWKLFFIWTVFIIVILGVGGLFAANYAVDKIILALAIDLESDLLTEEETAVIVTSKPKQQDEDNNQSAANQVEEAFSQADEKKTEQEVVPNKSEQVNNNGSVEDSAKQKGQEMINEGYSAEVSTNKVKDVQEKITVSEKAQVTSVFLQELSMTDIKEIQALVSGGLNLEEKKVARDIILEKLSAEQYDELIEVAKKYGMSQGKSYDQVIQEK